MAVSSYKHTPEGFEGSKEKIRSTLKVIILFLFKKHFLFKNILLTFITQPNNQTAGVSMVASIEFKNSNGVLEHQYTQKNEEEVEKILEGEGAELVWYYVTELPDDFYDRYVDDKEDLHPVNQ